MSFTLPPEQVQWLRKQAASAKISNSEVMQSALSYYRRLTGSEGSALRNLCTRYPSIFWDIKPEAISEGKHEEFVIERVLEHGTWASINDLLLIFNPRRISDVVRESRRIAPKTARFWAVRLGITGGIRCLEEESQNQLSEPWRH